MADYDDMCSLPNLQRAYRWIRTSSEITYKNLFRENYAYYALSSNENLKELSARLKDRTYEPSHASKIFFPKSSGILRPYTLLTVNDQIVYQACVNIIAEKLHKKVEIHHNKNVYHHIYAGKTSLFFYKEWREQYKKYTKSILKNYNSKKTWMADFDLTSFYDSIDHNVLSSSLRELSTDGELVLFLTRCLQIWTSIIWSNTSNAIHHGHGIPQGPLSSGLLSECIMRYLDDRGARKGSVSYLRYVDDIRLIAPSQHQLRQKLISLDLESKRLGLFPQTAKIDVRKVIDISEEIKSISIPAEEVLDVDEKEDYNQTLLTKRILELCRGGNIEPKNITRFKYMLGAVDPNYKLNEPLFQLIYNNPAISKSICSYINRYKSLPKKLSEKIVSYLTDTELYHSVNADILNSCLENLKEPYRSDIERFCYYRLTANKKNIPPQPSYKVALFKWALNGKKLSFTEYEGLLRGEIDWWVRQKMITHLSRDIFGLPSYKTILTRELKHKISDNSRAAAGKIIEENISFKIDKNNTNHYAKLPLKVVGLIDNVGRRESLIPTVLNYVFGKKLPKYNWRRFYKSKHSQAERLCIDIKAAYETDPDKCIVLLDSFCDLTFEIIFKKYKPSKKYGNYGAMLKSSTNDIWTYLPDLVDSFLTLNEYRKKSHTVHPRDLKTGKPTKSLKYWHLSRIKNPLRAGFENIVLYID